MSTQILARTREFVASHHIRVSGQGDNTIVLANGFGTDQSMWGRILPWLERRCRVVRFDWVIDPLHYDAARYSCVDGFVDDLVAVLTATNTASCHYVGHSMAGMIGMLTARKTPSAFRSMVMLAPSPCYMDKPGYHGGFSPHQIDQLLTDMGSNYLEWARNFSPMAVGAPADRPEVAEFTTSLLAMRPDVAFAMALTIFKLDVRDRLAGFDVPTTIVQTRDDIAVPVAVARHLHECWPNSTLEVIEASGHFPHMTAPAQLVAILGRHLHQH